MQTQMLLGSCPNHRVGFSCFFETGCPFFTKERIFCWENLSSKKIQLTVLMFWHFSSSGLGSTEEFTFAWNLQSFFSNLCWHHKRQNAELGGLLLQTQSKTLAPYLWLKFFSSLYSWIINLMGQTSSHLWHQAHNYNWISNVKCMWYP